jgi:hypothetical protein
MPAFYTHDQLISAIQDAMNCFYLLQRDQDLRREEPRRRQRHRRHLHQQAEELAALQVLHDQVQVVVVLRERLG